MKRIIFFIILFISYTANLTLAQLQYYSEDFDNYIVNVPLACQGPLEWTTWSNLPCSSEDPNITIAYSYSNPKSVVIIQNNDLIRLLGNASAGKNYIDFALYIPTDKSGYFSILSQFTPYPYERALECFFDVGETARLILGTQQPILFNYTNNQWQYVQLVVDFNTDEAQFWFDFNLIHVWEWSQNGTITNQLAAQNFYGPLSNNEIYMDNYELRDFLCLFCFPPTEPRNLTIQQNFTTEPSVQLNWQPSQYWTPRAYKIIRKIGFPSAATVYETLAYVPFSELQYVDSNVVIDSTYTYGVIAMNMYGYSDTSNLATITVDPVTNLNEKNNFTSYSLFQNYPNPFNPSTKINYTASSVTLRQAKSDIHVTLRVYDVLGNEVATLVDEEKPAGEYEIEFNATGLPSGIYFYQLKAGSFIETKKMILLK